MDGLWCHHRRRSRQKIVVKNLMAYMCVYVLDVLVGTKNIFVVSWKIMEHG